MAVRKTGKQYIKIRGANENNLKIWMWIFRETNLLF